MGILKSGDQIRLSGQDAEDYKRDTGRSVLPRTVNEFNAAHQQSADVWRSTDTPEGELLAFLNEQEILPQG